ncbi:MAG: hypothetical protein AAGI38_18645 [Bacteroidota bacterium]
MNICLILAFILSTMAFLVHTFVGDRELRFIEPKAADGKAVSLSTWTMARCGWHWISIDLLMASIGLGLAIWSNLPYRTFLLQLFAGYFLLYGAIWLVVIFISRSFKNNYLRLGQWMLLWVIGVLVWSGTL